MAVSFINMEVFGFLLYCAVLPWRGKPDAKEDAIYHLIQRNAQKAGWLYYRIENKLQNGFPDVMVYKGKQVTLIEAKVCRKSTFNNVLDDVTWQLGQVAFMSHALEQGMSYRLIVRHKMNLYVFKGNPYGNIETGPDLAQLF